MEAREIKLRDLLWWKYSDTGRLLVRVTSQAREFVTVRVLSAMPQQVLDSGYGVCELINTTAAALSPVNESEEK